VFQFYSVIA